MANERYVTVYNRYQNPDTRQEEWRRTVLGGYRETGAPAVYWEERKGVNVLQSGLTSADGLLLMIWFTATSEGKDYVEPAAYAALTPDEAALHWTLTPGHDRVFWGLVPDGEMKTLLARHTRKLTISSVDVCDVGSPAIWHWEVSGK